MSTRRTPPSGTRSHPDLSKLNEGDLGGSQITLRKRKNRDDGDQLIDFRDEIMSLIKESFLTQNESLIRLQEDMNIIKNQMQDIKHSHEVMVLEHKKLKEEFSQLKTTTDNEINLLQGNLTQANDTISNLSRQLSINDQLARMNNLEISGVPLMKSENLHNILHNVAVKVGITITSADVDYIHRVRRYPSKDGETAAGLTPNIIVRFTRRRCKGDMIAAVRARRGLTTADLGIDGPAKPVFVNDHLTPHNKMLYRQARTLGKENGYKFIWLNDCKIFLRKNEVSKSITIANESDLKKIK